MKKQVTDKIRKLREAKNLSQENVADALKIGSSAYAKIERGESDPNLARLFAIAEFLEVPVTAFFQAEPLYGLTGELTPGYSGKADIDQLLSQLQKLLAEIDLLRAEIAELKAGGLGKGGTG